MFKKKLTTFLISLGLGIIGLSAPAMQAQAASYPPPMAAVQTNGQTPPPPNNLAVNNQNLSTQILDAMPELSDEHFSAPLPVESEEITSMDNQNN